MIYKHANVKNSKRYQRKVLGLKAEVSCVFVMDRIILHVDLDAFYASLEELRKPEIRGKPVVVCVYSGRTEESGAVATSNYLARELGIRAGMPIAYAKRAAKGHDVVFLPTDLDYYRETSERIMELLEEHADRFQQVSIDEAYLDVSETCRGDYGCAEKIAQEIKQEIKVQEGVTCSVGIGANKYVSKMAGKRKKPDGLTMVLPGTEADFLKDLPVGKLHGIGGKTEAELEDLGIKTASDLAGYSLNTLEEKFGKNKAKLLRDKSLGIDESPVEQKEKQQLSRIATLKQDTSDAGEAFVKVKELAEDLQKRLINAGTSFRTLTLITINNRLGMQTRSQSIEASTDINAQLPILENMLKKFLNDDPTPLRRIGVKVSNLSYRKQEKKQKTLADYGL